jgi:hypothetical protein
MPAVRAEDKLSADTPALPAFSATPAFDVLGLTPSGVQRPATVREFGADLLSGIDKSGQLKAGVAVEAAPYWLARGRGYTMTEWRSDATARLLSGLALSVASVARTDGTGTALAQGVRWTLFDGTDPRWDEDLENCIIDAIKPPMAPSNTAVTADSGRPIPPPTAAAAKSAAKHQFDNPGVADCKKMFQDRKPAGSALAIAAALSEKQGTTRSDVSLDEIALWATYSADVVRDTCAECTKTKTRGGWLQLILSGHTKRSIQANENSLDAGARFRLGSDAAAFSLDGSWSPSRGSDQTWHWDGARFAAVAEARIAESLWLTFTGGGRVGGTDTEPRLFTNVSFKAAFGREGTIVQ